MEKCAPLTEDIILRICLLLVFPGTLIDKAVNLGAVFTLLEFLLQKVRRTLVYLRSFYFCYMNLNAIAQSLKAMYGNLLNLSHW